MCGKRKVIEQFPRQYYTDKNGKRTENRRHQCKKCHQDQTVEYRKHKHTLEERREYMRNYMKTYRR